MARPVVDISMIGDKELSKTLAGLPAVLQKSIVRKAIRPASKEHILAEVKRRTPVKTGRLKRSLKLRAYKRSRSRIGLVIKLPERSELGIESTTSKSYYPTALEYGAPSRNIAPMRYIRGPVNANTRRWQQAVGQGIGLIMEDEIKKFNARMAAKLAKARG